MNLFTPEKTLLLVAQGAGILLLLSVVWLLNKRVIYLDAKTKQLIEVELPVFGKVKTQSPVIALVLIAASLVIVPITQMRPSEVSISGNVETDGPPRYTTESRNRALGLEVASTEFS